MFPCVSLLVSHFTEIFQPPCPYHLPPFIGSCEWEDHHYFPTLHTFLRSSKSQGDPHDFRGFSWNLFQTSDNVQEWFPNGTIRPWPPYCWVRVAPQLSRYRPLKSLTSHLPLDHHLDFGVRPFVTRPKSDSLLVYQAQFVWWASGFRLGFNQGDKHGRPGPTHPQLISEIIPIFT